MQESNRQFGGGIGIRMLFLLLILTQFVIGVVWSARADDIQYIYDSLNRLVEVRYSNKTIRYIYDAAGNRTQIQIEGVNPLPSLVNLNPSNAIAGGSGFTLTVTGSNFVNNAVVKWNGADRMTTFTSDTQVQAAILNTDIASTGTASITVVNPAPGGGTSNALDFTITQNCSFSIKPSDQAFDSGGGTGLVTVTSQVGCNWMANSNDSWLTITSGGSGSGNGIVGFTVEANPNPALRTGTLIVAGQTFTVNQAGINCSYSISSTSQSFTPSGGNGSLNVTTLNGCSWMAITTDPWITITSGTGNGNGPVNYSVALNTDSTRRVGTITVANQTFTVLQGATFLDVPVGAPFYTEIGKLSARGVTLGCGNGNYCTDAVVTREQMAAFIMRALGEFNPPPPATQRFDDVPPTHPFYAFIDRMAVLQITLGCSATPPLYCPANSVSREQMAAFMIRALHAPGYIPPPPASQRFNDVLPENPFYAHIEEMALRGITLGCSGNPPLYCPTQSVTRAQMAAFLVRAFGL
jgi:hypothetical protein